MEKRTADVLIVGAGPTGLMMANLLKLQNISFRIIDKKEGPTDLSKALGVQPRTLELFEQIGLSLEGMPVTSAHLHANKEEIGVVDFTKIDSKFDHVTIFPQSDMEKLLIGKLEKTEKKIAWKTELIDIQDVKDGVEVRLQYDDGRLQTEQYTWVVGCDGAHSAVRHKMGVSFSGTEDKACFGLADVELESEMPANQIVTNIAKAGLFASFPMPDGKFRLVVDRLDPDGDLSEDDWNILYSDRSPVPGKIQKIHWQSKFYINYRLARHFKQGHLLLAGDAAHIHSPAGGQGMNTGLQDAFNLAWKLGLQIHNRAHPDLLRSYETERKQIGHEILALSHGMTRMTKIRSSFLGKLRNKFIHNMLAKPKVNLQMATRIAQLSLAYHGSRICQDTVPWSLTRERRYFKEGPRPGHRAPFLPNASGYVHHLYIFGLSSKSFTDKHKEECLKCLQKIRDKLATEIIPHLITTTEDHPLLPTWDGDHILDTEKHLHRTYHALVPSLFILRPDGYIAARSMILSATYFKKYLAAVFDIN